VLKLPNSRLSRSDCRCPARRLYIRRTPFGRRRARHPANIRALAPCPDVRSPCRCRHRRLNRPSGAERQDRSMSLRSLPSWTLMMAEGWRLVSTSQSEWASR
jgi:hypothetical protein